MKRGAPEHPKTYTLAAQLGIERWGAVGILESLWHYTAKYAPAGDVGRYPDDAIARAIGWTGDAPELARALVFAGWLDECSCHRLRVHDWNTHCDQTVQRVVDRNFLPCYAKASRKLANAKQKLAAVAVPCRSRAVAVPSRAEPGPEQASPPDEPPEQPPDEAQSLRREIAALLAEEQRLSGRGVDEILHEWSFTGSASITNLAGCSRIPWLIATRDRGKTAKLRRRAEENPPARAGPMNPADRAGKWIADHGGTAIVARAVVEWADRERIEGETDQEASRRWASDVPDGSHVLSVLGAALYYERKRRDAVEAGRALPSGNSSP